MVPTTALKIEPHIRGWKTYNKKERTGKCLSKRERERERERRGMGEKKSIRGR